MRAIAQTPTWRKHYLLALLLVMGSLVLFMTSALAADNHQSFAKDKWYIGKGGKAVSLKDFAQNPRHYLRSEAAYTYQRDHLARVVGKTTMSDAEFRDLLMSDKVRLVPCVGRIKTAGIKKDGVSNWFERACYKDEYLIEVQVPNGWVAPISQGCLNPLEFTLPRPIAPSPAPATEPQKTPPATSPPPEVKTAVPASPPPECRFVGVPVAVSSPQVIQTPGRVVDSCFSSVFGSTVYTGQMYFVEGGVILKAETVCNQPTN